MTTDIPSMLAAASGAIPTLLLALVFQKPLLLGLIRVADMYREGIRALEVHRIGRLILLVAPAGTSAFAKNIDYAIIAVGTLGMISSVGLQTVPADDWSGGGLWTELAQIVLWTHLAIVALLAFAVGGGLLVVTRGARADPGVAEPGV